MSTETNEMPPSGDEPNKAANKSRGQKTIGGHTLDQATLFKFAGLIAFIVLIAVIVVVDEGKQAFAAGLHDVCAAPVVDVARTV